MNKKTFLLAILIYYVLFVPYAIGRNASKTLIAEIDDSRMVRGTLKISPDYKRIAYIAFDPKSVKKTYSVVLDSKYGKQYDDIEDLTFSPDSRRFAYVAKAGNQSCVVVDGKDGSKYDRIRLDGFTSDSKNIVCRIYENGKWRAAFNDNLGRPYKGIGPVHFGPDDNIAYVIEERTPKGKEWDCHSHLTWVVYNENEGKKFDCARVESSRNWLFTFSRDGKRLAYVVKESGKRGYAIYADGKEVGSGYREVEWVDFSLDSTKLCYIAEDNNYNWVVIDNGKEVAKYNDRKPLFAHYSPDSKRTLHRYYYNVRGKSGDGVAIDGVEGKSYKKIWWGPIFSPDSTRVVYVACDETDKALLVIAGQNGEVDLEMPLPFGCERIGGNLPKLELSRNLQQMIYVAREGNKRIVKTFELLDREITKKHESKQYDQAYNIVFSPDCRNIAYVANVVDKYGHTKELVVMNNKEGERYIEVEKPFFVDDNTLRYIAWEGKPIVAGNKIYHRGNKLYLIEEKIK